MELHVRQKVVYPGQGVCVVEAIRNRKIGGDEMSVYRLRVLNDSTTIVVPTENAENVGVRPLIDKKQCKTLIRNLSEDFDGVSDNWKTRSRMFIDKLQSGDIFATADVLKQLTYLSSEKRLSFREQTLLEKAKFLVVSEITNANQEEEDVVSREVSERIESACAKHLAETAKAANAASG